jgi:hypothetical protein
VHFTLRLTAGTGERLQRRARNLGAAPRTLAARYIEEGIRHDDHPLVHFLDGETGRRAALLGKPLDVWEVIATVRDNGNDVAAAAEYLRVPRGLIEAAVTYYGEFREEIDAEIARNDAESERALQAYRQAHAALGA